jgi:hypothetical protein
LCRNTILHLFLDPEELLDQILMTIISFVINIRCINLLFKFQLFFYLLPVICLNVMSNLIQSSTIFMSLLSKANFVVLSALFVAISLAVQFSLRELFVTRVRHQNNKIFFIRKGRMLETVRQRLPFPLYCVAFPHSLLYRPPLSLVRGG